MIGHHPAFDVAYRAALTLIAAELPSDLATELGDDVVSLRALSSPEVRFLDQDRKRIHASIELHRTYRERLVSALSLEEVGSACWLWLTRPIPEWAAMVQELTAIYDTTTLRTRERDRLAASLEERTEQWRMVMRQLSTATAELERIGSPVQEASAAPPLSAKDWDAILAPK